MITKKQWKEFEHLRSEVYELQSEIELSIFQILDVACEIHNVELDTWYYPNAPEGGMGEMLYDADTIAIVVELKKDRCIDIPYMGRYHVGCDYDLSTDFPIELLFVSLDEAKDRITKDLEQIKAKEAEKKRKAKEKRLAKEEKKNKLKELAAKKLTLQERKALGL